MVLMMMMMMMMGDDDNMLSFGPNCSTTGPAPPPPPPPSACMSDTKTTNIKSPAGGTRKVEKDKQVEVSLNGGDCPGYVWAQLRDEVVIRIWVPPNTKAKDLGIRLEKAESKSLDQRLVVQMKSSGAIILDEVIAHPVKMDDETGR